MIEDENNSIEDEMNDQNHPLAASNAEESESTSSLEESELEDEVNDFN